MQVECTEKKKIRKSNLRWTGKNDIVHMYMVNALTPLQYWTQGENIICHIANLRVRDLSYIHFEINDLRTFQGQRERNCI